MQTLSEILGRRAERQNLRNMGFCILVTLSLVVTSFGIARMRSLFQDTTHSGQGETVAVEASADH